MEKYVKKACDISSEILNDCIKNIPNFKTEKDIYLYLIRETRKRKLRLAFKPIVANNNPEIHAKPRDIKLKKGFLIIDFGVKYKGYCSDITRTVYLGNPSKREEDIYNLVLDVQKNSIRKIKPNVKCFDVDGYARKSFGRYKKYFLHSLGHGVGKKVHKSPKISPKSKNLFKKGQIFTIEPGLYFKNKFGIRIEDTIILKEKPEILSNKINKNLKSVKSFS